MRGIHRGDAEATRITFGALYIIISDQCNDRGLSGIGKAAARCNARMQSGCTTYDLLCWLYGEEEGGHLSDVERIELRELHFAS